MKKFLLAMGLSIIFTSFATTEAQNININVNIGSQPAWGPVGYNYVDYYYMPDINVYYNVPLSIFHYLDRGRWVSARYLPYSYRNYDLYRMYKVVLNDRNPWKYNKYHVNDYSRYRGIKNQVVIYNSNDNRYRNSKRNTTLWYNDDRNTVKNSGDYYGNRSKFTNNTRYSHEKYVVIQNNSNKKNNSSRNNRYNDSNSKQIYTQVSERSESSNNTRQSENASRSGQSEYSSSKRSGVKR